MNSTWTSSIINGLRSTIAEKDAEIARLEIEIERGDLRMTTKMVKCKWSIETGYAGAVHRGEWEVPEGTTEEELELMLQDEIGNHISATYWTDEE